MPELPTATRNACCDACVDMIDQGSGAGKLVIKNSGDATLVTITLNDPAFGAANTGVATLDVDPALSNTPIASGTADYAELTDSDDTVILDNLTVGTSGAEINLDSLSIDTGVDVSVTSGTVTMPAS